MQGCGQGRMFRLGRCPDDLSLPWMYIILLSSCWFASLITVLISHDQIIIMSRNMFIQFEKRFPCQIVE